VTQPSDRHRLLHPIGPVPQTDPERLFSTNALRRAWLAVKRAGGGAGVDGVTLQTFDADIENELDVLRNELVSGSYRPKPVRRILVPKRTSGLRAVALWALRDRVAQRLVYDIIAPSFEAIFLPCSYGFRPGRSVQDAVNQLLAYRDQNLRWVVDADIKDCFDQIDSARLMPLVRERVHDPLLLRYVQRWLEANIFNSADGVPALAGASQGSVLSPLLANIYLHRVDLALTGRGLALIRYADDLVICCRRKAEAETARSALQEAVGAWGLRLNTRKSAIVHFDAGFSWLGYFFVRREYYQL